ncbi:MAG TPA: FhaA domain-containing protein [Kineosporiaceae bacterium]|nr:FhaA domain-containing protein [Kineosporiaceae bacterium]
MGVLDRFEKGIERAVNGAFAKAFRSEVQPVEIASALRRECDDRSSIVGRDRTIAPNNFVVELGPADYERLGEWKDALGDELTAVVHDHARQQRYAFVGPVGVTFEQADDLDTGVFRVRSATSRPQGETGYSSGQPAGYGQAPAPGYGPGGPFAGQAPTAYPQGQPYQNNDPYQRDAYQQDPYAAREGYPQAPAQPEPYPGGYPAESGYAGYPPEESGHPAAGAAWPGQSRGGQLATLDVDGQPHQLAKQVTVLGRALDADVVLDDPGVSRRHAEIHLIDGRARVIDLGSTNGTFVDGERVHAGDLNEGSTITVGRTRIVFHSGQW